MGYENDFLFIYLIPNNQRTNSIFSKSQRSVYAITGELSSNRVSKGPLPHSLLPNNQVFCPSIISTPARKSVSIFPSASDLLSLPSSSVAPLRRWFGPKQLLSLSGGSWALPSHHALCPCQESVPVHTPLAENTCRDPVFSFLLHSFEAPVPNTHRAQVGIHKKHLSLLLFTQSRNILLAGTRRGWNKEIFGAGQ